MVKKTENSSKDMVKGAATNVTPLVAAYYLGYMLSQKGEKISDENVEDLYAGACHMMGIDPVEDISEFFNELFGPRRNKEPDLENSYYC